MPEADVQPHTVTIERVLPSPPTRIFRAFADSRQRRIWDVPEDGWIVTDHHQDFRVGGAERRRFGPPDAATFHTFGHYLHIEADRLIISSGVMHHNDVPITASLCTIDITAHPDWNPPQTHRPISLPRHRNAEPTQRRLDSSTRSTRHPPHPTDTPSRRTRSPFS